MLQRFDPRPQPLTRQRQSSTYRARKMGKGAPPSSRPSTRDPYLPWLSRSSLAEDHQRFAGADHERNPAQNPRCQCLSGWPVLPQRGGFVREAFAARNVPAVIGTPCTVEPAPGTTDPVQSHSHLGAGMGSKVSDEFTVPFAEPINAITALERAAS